MKVMTTPTRRLARTGPNMRDRPTRRCRRRCRGPRVRRSSPCHEDLGHYAAAHQMTTSVMAGTTGCVGVCLHLSSSGQACSSCPTPRSQHDQVDARDRQIRLSAWCIPDLGPLSSNTFLSRPDSVEEERARHEGAAKPATPIQIQTGHPIQPNAIHRPSRNSTPRTA